MHFLHKVRPYRVAQSDERDPLLKSQLVAKLQKAWDHHYIGPGRVTVLTAFFVVKKSDTDVGHVYDRSVSGFNEGIWMPRFTLPTILSHLRQVEA